MIKIFYDLETTGVDYIKRCKEARTRPYTTKQRLNFGLDEGFIWAKTEEGLEYWAKTYYSETAH